MKRPVTRSSVQKHARRSTAVVKRDMTEENNKNKYVRRVQQGLLKDLK